MGNTDWATFIETIFNDFGIQVTHARCLRDVNLLVLAVFNCPEVTCVHFNKFAWHTSSFVSL